MLVLSKKLGALCHPHVLAQGLRIRIVLVATSPVANLSVLCFDFQPAAGPDEVSNAILKQLSSKGKQCLLLTANPSWRSGDVPSQWRVADIRSKLKPGKPAGTTSSFRPISLLSCIGKLVERLIQERLVYQLESRNLIHPSQASFRRNRSCEEQVAAVYQLIEDGFQQ